MDLLDLVLRFGPLLAGFSVTYTVHDRIRDYTQTTRALAFVPAFVASSFTVALFLYSLTFLPWSATMQELVELGPGYSIGSLFTGFLINYVLCYVVLWLYNKTKDRSSTRRKNRSLQS